MWPEELPLVGPPFDPPLTPLKHTLYICFSLSFSKWHLYLFLHQIFIAGQHVLSHANSACLSFLLPLYFICIYMALVVHVPIGLSHDFLTSVPSVS